MAGQRADIYDQRSKHQTLLIAIRLASLSAQALHGIRSAGNLMTNTSSWIMKSAAKEPGNSEGHAFKVMVFVGAHQAKLPFELASSLQAPGGNAEYVKIGGNGANVPDFHTAFYIGRLVERDTDACFHIIPRDTGFDQLSGA